MQIFTLGKPALNGGQIAKDYLISSNVNINFDNCKRKNDTTIIRKAKKKCCNEISVPTDINITKLKYLLAEKLENGEYAIGNLVIPKTYQKLILKNGVVSTEEFTLQSRKINLIYI